MTTIQPGGTAMLDDDDTTIHLLMRTAPIPPAPAMAPSVAATMGGDEWAVELLGRLLRSAGWSIRWLVGLPPDGGGPMFHFPDPPVAVRLRDDESADIDGMGTPVTQRDDHRIDEPHRLVVDRACDERIRKEALRQLDEIDLDDDDWHMVPLEVLARGAATPDDHGH